MFLHQLQFFTILAMVIAVGPAERSGVKANEFDQRTPSYPGNALRAKSEVRPPVLLPVQSRNVQSLRAGMLLVASRDLADPNFAHTVVLLVHYDAQSVVGLVLNRRTDVPLSRVLEGLKAAKDRSDRVYLGGPVERPTVFGLLQSTAKLEGAEHVFGGTYLIASKTLFEQTISTRPDPGVFHVYLGYAGWTRNQLRMEVIQGAWFIFPGDAQTVFSSDPDSLWPQMIRKTEMKVARRESADSEGMPSDKLQQVLYQGTPSEPALSLPKGVPSAPYSQSRLQALARGVMLFRSRIRASLHELQENSALYQGIALAMP